MWKLIAPYQHLIYIFLVVGLPVLGRIFKKLEEQARKRRAGINREQQELEQLRTGRSAPIVDSGQAARAALQEMAVKRRAQIEELRQRRLAAMAGAASAGTPVPQVAPRPVVSPPVNRSAGVSARATGMSAGAGRMVQAAPDEVMSRRETGQQGAPVQPIAERTSEGPRDGMGRGVARGMPQRRAEPTAQERAGERAVQRVEQEGRQREQKAAMERQKRALEVAKKQESRDRAARGARRENQAVAAGAAIAAGAAAAVGGTGIAQAAATVLRAPAAGGPVTAKDWRRAIIMQELLAKPVSMR